MTEEAFWKLIDQSLACMEAGHYQIDCLAELLRGQNPREIVEFREHVDRLIASAYSGPLWAACTLLNAGYGSDDGFLYFRCWLVSCGKAVYYRALQAPDSLADVEVEMTEHGPSAEFEEFLYVAVDAYAHVTDGGDIYEQLPDAAGSDDADDHWGSGDYESQSWLEENLPRLWDRFGQYWLKGQLEPGAIPAFGELVEAYDFPGVGRLTVGGDIYHAKDGQGVVKAIDLGDDGEAIVYIDFGVGPDGEARRRMMFGVELTDVFPLSPLKKSGQ